ncbi:MAG: NUDIX hydrolase [Oscillospiraceae bacterium]|jgi:ADP-ribose pyrophosphatase|nr:NUDIX hydrolase [Oscillospiraceae bacterium]
MSYTEKRVSGETMFTGKVFSVRRDEAVLHNGKRVTREVVEHNGGVVIVPFTDAGRILMVKQYRYPIGEEMLELPAGRLEPGEGHRKAARRELSEETGYRAKHLMYLGVIYPSPGFCEEALHMYVAFGLRRGEAHPDEDEFLTVKAMRPEKVLDMIKSSAITDAKTIAGVFKAILCIMPDELRGQDGGRVARG